MGTEGGGCVVILGSFYLWFLYVGKSMKLNQCYDFLTLLYITEKLTQNYTSNL